MNKWKSANINDKEFSYFVQQFDVLRSIVKEVEVPTIANCLVIERRWLKPSEQMNKRIKEFTSNNTKWKSNIRSLVHHMKMVNSCYESNLEKLS